VPLDQASVALNQLERGEQMGKLVLEVTR
jgi:hypothetical protein